MNVTFLFKKTPTVFLLLLCFVISINFAEAERSIRVRKIKSHVSPRHISVLARSGNGVYARRYAYGRSIPNYSTKGNLGKNRRYYSVRSGPGKRRNLSRNYASGFPNWTPNTNASGRRDNPRADNFGPQKKRKGLYPFLKEPPLGGFKQKRRARPNRLNSIQKPRPPKTPNEFEDDYFFPEEAQRTETKYEFESRFPRPKKKRRPDSEQSFRKPDFSSNIPYYDEKPLSYKPKPREPPFSYSSFVQHPSGYQDESDDLFDDTDGLYTQPVAKKKKKRVKKPNSRKKNKDQFKPFVFENDQPEESYPPYINQEEYELPAKRYKKRNKPSYDSDEDDFVPNLSPQYVKPKPQLNTLFNTDTDYRSSQNTQQTSQFSPSYPQSWSQANAVETTARPVQYQTENGFQPQPYIPNQYNYNKDYSNLQTVKTATNTQQSTYYSHIDNNYKNDALSNKYKTDAIGNKYKNDAFNNNYNYVNTKITSSQQPTQTPPNYNIYSNNVYSSQATYSQPVPSSASSTLTDVTIQKSVPIYDNTETFYNFNNNAYVNSQSSKYYNTPSSPNYGTRISTSYRNKVGEKTGDSDNEFIKKHQNLYNNGLSGVPVQGDGYAKEGGKKDYDIGYGDFQFDENPTS